MRRTEAEKIEKPKGSVRRMLRDIAGLSREERSSGSIPPLRLLIGGNDTVIPSAQKKQKQPPEYDGHVHLRMFHPDSLKKGYLNGFIHDYYGHWDVKWLAIDAMQRKRYETTHHGEEMPNTDKRDALRRKFTRDVNMRFRDRVKSHFGPKDSSVFNPSAFLAEHLKVANATIREFTETLYPQASTLLPRTETDTPPISPAQTIIDIASGDDVRSFEEIRRHLLAFISAEDSIYRDGHIADTKDSQVSKLLGDKLFGSIPQDIVIRGLFDNNTNDIIYLEGDDIPSNPILPENSHVKKFTRSLRTMKGRDGQADIKVFYDPNRKTDQSTYIKALRDAEKRARKGGNDIVEPEVDSRDRNRIGIGVLGGEQEVAIVVERVFETLKDNPRLVANLDDSGEPIIDFVDDAGTPHYKGRYLYSQPKPRRGDDEDQSTDVNFQRYELYFHGLAYPIELRVQTVDAQLRESIQVGSFEQEQGRYSGAAHDLVRLSQLRRISKFLLHPRIYERESIETPSGQKRQKRKIIDLEQTALNTMHEKARQLRMMGRSTIT